MTNLFQKFIGAGFYGKYKRYRKHCADRGSLFDESRIFFYVSDWKKGGKPYFTYSASCYCNDAILVSDAGNYVSLYRSKEFSTKQEAALAMESEVLNASKEFKDVEFYMSRYYPEHDAIGESLICKNSFWSEGEYDVKHICPECKKSYSSVPANRVCNGCGGFVT